MMTTKHYFFLAILSVFCLSTQAQLQTPAASPSSKLEQEVGLMKVTIEYSRPSMKGRTIFGDLVPYGEMWRFGANASTQITFSDDVTLNGHAVGKGTYALYAIPHKDKWTMIVHKNLNHWGTGGNNYKQEEDLVRFDVATQTLPMDVESFTVTIDGLHDSGADLWFLWENTAAKVELKTETDKKVMASIDRVLEGPTAGTYYQMASYYYNHNKDINKALEWVNKAVEGGERYWVVTLKARIHAKLGDKNNAIKASKRAIELAENVNPDYVRMNKKMIAEWEGQ